MQFFYHESWIVELVIELSILLCLPLIRPLCSLLI